MEIAFIFLGIAIAYTWVHFLVIQFMKNWSDRSGYERALTIVAIVTFVLHMLGS